MPNVKISDLPAASSAAGTDQLETNQGGTSRRLTVAQVATHVRSTATDTVVVAAGSASAPSIAPTGDSNTGIFFPAADTIAFSEGGVEALRIDSSGNATFAGTAAMASSYLRNRILNGDCRIDQRNNGGSVNISASGDFGIDRWYAVEDSDGTMTMQRSTTAPAGFTNSLAFTTGTADTSLSASQHVVMGQQIEGVNVYDLGWGTASAQTITLSFWVRSSLTGTFGGAVRNSASNRSYPFTYSISAANTWEYKTVTIPGDTSGTWLTDTGVGIRLTFGLGVGSNWAGTAGAWAGSNLLSATGAVSVIGTASATWNITGVQLEVGSAATPFERRQFGQELALCQRYFSKTFPTSTAVQDKTGTNVGAIACNVLASVTGFYGSLWQYPVNMRATPTLAFFAPQSSGANNWVNGGNNVTSGPTSAGLSSDRTYIFMANGNAFSLGGADVFYIHATANAEL